MSSGWNRAEAIREVMEASDGFGRPWAEQRGTLIQACVFDLVLDMRENPGRTIVLERDEEWLKYRIEVGPRDKLVRRCRRPGCSGLFEWKVKKLYCSERCSQRENRRRASAKRRG